MKITVDKFGYYEGIEWVELRGKDMAKIIKIVMEK